MEGIWVRNASDVPVTRAVVAARVRQEAFLLRTLDTVGPTADAEFLELDDTERSGLERARETFPNDPVLVTITFVDAANVPWTRHAYRGLEEKWTGDDMLDRFHPSTGD